MLFAKFWRGKSLAGYIFSRDNLKGGNIGVRASGREVLGVYYLLENIITANLKGGAVKGGKIPPLPPH